MKKGYKNFNYFAAGMSMLILCSCASPKIKTDVLVAAKYSEVAELRRMAVLPFDHKRRKNPAFTTDVEAMLTSIRVHDKSYFNVIERTQLNKVIEEMRLGGSGIVDQSTATNIGKIAGVQAILMGTITQSDSELSKSTETRYKCAKKNSKGICKKLKKYKAACLTRKATFTFVPKIIRISNGGIVMSESITRSSSSKGCKKEKPDSETALLGRAKKAALKDFQNKIAPYYVKQNLALISKDDSKPSTKIKKRIKGGIKFAEAGRMDRACEIWRNAALEHTKGYALPYLQGVCAESESKLVEAMDLYKLADRRTSEPVKEINNALNRVNSRLNNKSKLKQQMRK